MSHTISVTFLGTTSGGGPTETRSCSSLVVDTLGDGSLWMVDCAEGTLRQFALQPFHDARRVKVGKVTKIFITHMHADHNMGVLTVLRSALGIPPPGAPIEPSASSSEPAPPPRIEIYGPRGIRRLLRTLVALTHTHTNERFAVHELLFAGEQPSAPAGAEAQADGEACEANEAPGRDIRCDADGFWRGIVDAPVAGRGGARAVVDAGPIEHRDPCLGLVIREVPRDAPAPHTPVPRTLVILGDTSDPARLAALLAPPPPSADALAPTPPCVALLVHEATDAHMPPAVDPQARLGRNRTAALVAERTRARGHSTPCMAGAFARRIGAERLVLNHIGSRFPAPEPGARSAGERFRLACMREIERQATDEWAPPRGVHAQAAWDFMRVVVPPNAPAQQGAEAWYGETRSEHVEVLEDGAEVRTVSERCVEVRRHTENEMAGKRHRPRGGRRGADHRGGYGSQSDWRNGEQRNDQDKRMRLEDDRR